jgi:hypothetical protein
MDHPREAGMHLVVAHYVDGRVLRGSTSNFQPGRDRFHLLPQGQNVGGRPTEVLLADLKALFFVKDLRGNPNYRERIPPEAGHGPSRRLRVTFKDGEVLEGTTQAYQPGRPAFFVVPLDPDGNNERCYVLTAATQSVAVL